jgi:hypothetical protein
MSMKITNSEAQALLKSYGLGDQLSTEDDPRLWATVIIERWGAADSPRLPVSGLRMGVATHDPTTGMRLRPIAGWRFKRDGAASVRPHAAADPRNADPLCDPTLAPGLDLTLFYLPFAGIDYPYLSIVFGRPSSGMTAVAVFTGSAGNGRTGLGQTRLWHAHPDGWIEGDAILAQWIS